MKKFLMTAVVAGAVALGAGSASAATLAETLAALGLTQAQIATVISASGETTVSTSATPFNWNGTLIKRGSRGSQVMALQACMNNLGYSTGVVDGIYGSNTFNGITAFQASKGYAVDGIVGPQTAPGFENACNGTTVVVEDDMEDEDEDTDIPTFGNGEEADIEESDTSKGDADDVYANMQDQSVAMFEIEVDEDGGDLRVDRVDVYVEVSGLDEEDLYDIIEKITLEVDGDEVASEDTDDEDDWRDLENSDSEGYFRLNNVNEIIEAGDTTEFDVLFDIADLDNDDDLPIDVTVSFEIRYTDEAGITEEYTISGSEDFQIEALDDVEFDLDENNDNPEDYTVSLDDDADDVVMLVNDVKVDEQGGMLEDVVITYEIDADLTGEDVDDLVAEAYLSLDGEEFDAEDINDLVAVAASCSDGVSTDEATCVAASETWTEGSTTFTVEFEIDDEIEFDIDDEWELVAWFDLEELEDGSAFIGTELVLTTIEFQGEGDDEDDFSVTEDADNAPEVSLSAGALLLESSSVDGYEEFGDDDNAAEATFMVEVKADGDENIRIDAFVFDVDGTEQIIDLANDTVTGGSYAYTVGGADYTFTIVDEDEDDVVAAFEINDGSTEEFEIIVVLDNVGGTAGNFRLELDRIEWTEDTADNDFGAGATEGELETSVEAEDINLTA